VILYPLTLVLSVPNFGSGLFYYGKIKKVVGEYVRDYGFLPPNPVSMHPEYLRLLFEIE
jgi:hypothetical protein